MNDAPPPHSLMLVVGPPDMWVYYVKDWGDEQNPDSDSFPAVSYAADRQELGWAFMHRGLITQGDLDVGKEPGGSVWEDFKHAFQAQYPGQWEELEGKAKGKRKTKGAGEQPPKEESLPDEGPHIELLKDPRLVRRLLDAITAPAPGSKDPLAKDSLIGESANAIQLVLIILAKRSAQFEGLTGAGKSAIVAHVLGVVDPKTWKKLGGLSDKGIRYLEDGVKILYIAERRGIESGKTGRDKDETTAEYDVKLSMSEGWVEWGIVEHDSETRKNVLILHRKKIDSFITTTTEVESAEEYENRLFVLQADDSEPQNRRVRELQLAGALTYCGAVRDWSAERATALLAIKYVIAKAPEAGRVLVPFALALRPMLTTSSPSVRRLTPKLLDLVNASARLHFLQRERTPDGEGLVADWRDLAIVLATSRRSLETAQSGISEKAKLAYGICQELEAKGVKITANNVRLNAGDQASRLGGRQTVWRCVKALKDAGALIPTQDKDEKFTVYHLGDAMRGFGGVDIKRIVQDAQQHVKEWVKIGKPLDAAPLLRRYPDTDRKKFGLAVPGQQEPNLSFWQSDTVNSVPVDSMSKHQPKAPPPNSGTNPTTSTVEGAQP